jgi:hypothetical protein
MLRIRMLLVLMVFSLVVGAGTASAQMPKPTLPPPPPPSDTPLVVAPPPGEVPFPPPGPPPMDPERQIQAPPLQMVAPGVYEIGEVRIFKKESKVEFPCQVNMADGLLEYAVVGNYGKVHESLLRTRVEPYALQIALLLLGLEPTTNPLSMQGDPRRPEGSPVNLRVRWQEGELPREARIEEWIVNREDGAPMKPTSWIYTGSVVANGVFLAQVERSIVAIFHDPVAMIDNPLPEGGSGKIWFANPDKVPVPGTEVTVVIQREAEPPS